jgi:hypothetical protein
MEHVMSNTPLFILASLFVIGLAGMAAFVWLSTRWLSRQEKKPRASQR